MEKPYLIVRKFSDFGAELLWAIGPFDGESDMMSFAKGIRFAGGETYLVAGVSSDPGKARKVSPGEFFPWDFAQLQCLDVDSLVAAE